MKYTTEQLELAVNHIIESGANTIRIIELINEVSKQRINEYKTMQVQDAVLIGKNTKGIPLKYLRKFVKWIDSGGSTTPDGNHAENLSTMLQNEEDYDVPPLTGKEIINYFSEYLAR